MNMESIMSATDNIAVDNLFWIDEDDDNNILSSDLEIEFDEHDMADLPLNFNSKKGKVR